MARIHVQRRSAANTGRGHTPVRVLASALVPNFRLGNEKSEEIPGCYRVDAYKAGVTNSFLGVPLRGDADAALIRLALLLAPDAVGDLVPRGRGLP